MATGGEQVTEACAAASSAAANSAFASVEHTDRLTLAALDVNKQGALLPPVMNSRSVVPSLTIKYNTGTVAFAKFNLAQKWPKRTFLARLLLYAVLHFVSRSSLA